MYPQPKEDQMALFTFTFICIATGFSGIAIAAKREIDGSWGAK